MNYDHDRPYRDRIIEIHKVLGLTMFTSTQQFWTLGGPNHCEFKYLDQYLRFEPQSYHTVDRNRMDTTDNLPNAQAVIAYPYTEFDDVTFFPQYSPLAISYDSTEILTNKTDKIDDLIELAFVGLKNNPTKRLVMHANYMVSYPAIRSIKNSRLAIKEELSRWKGMFVDQMEFWGYDVECTNWSNVERMETSRTDMVDMHFYITK